MPVPRVAIVGRPNVGKSSIFNWLAGRRLAIVEDVAGVTRDRLTTLIEHGQFRKDLFYRLRGVTIHLPPLRDRREDLAELAHHFLFRYNRQLDTAVQSISPEALERLQTYHWPGNVRELQSVIREALIVSAGPTLLPDFLPAELHQDTQPDTDTDVETNLLPAPDWASLPQDLETWLASGQTDLYRRAREQLDRLVILRVLQAVGGNRHRAAEILGLSKVTLRAKLRTLGLSVDKVVVLHPDEDPAS